MWLVWLKLREADVASDAALDRAALGYVYVISPVRVSLGKTSPASVS